MQVGHLEGCDGKLAVTCKACAQDEPCRSCQEHRVAS
jgi:hypothetical protein